MRGLLATAYVLGFALFSKLARRALRRSEVHSARAQWCHERAADLDASTFDHEGAGASSTTSQQGNDR